MDPKGTRLERDAKDFRQSERMERTRADRCVPFERPLNNGDVISLLIALPASQTTIHIQPQRVDLATTSCPPADACAGWWMQPFVSRRP